MSPTAKKADARREAAGGRSAAVGKLAATGARPAKKGAAPVESPGKAPGPAKRSRTSSSAAPRSPEKAKKATKKAVKSAVPSKRSSVKARPGGPYADDEKFLAEQRQMLLAERAVYEAQASDLKAEADSLAQEREPGDVQFDEESGEGGTVTVDRERDLALSAQALAAVEEIDEALARVEDGTYGACERCHQPIPKPRLRALPFARLCVACKSGGLSRR